MKDWGITIWWLELLLGQGDDRDEHVMSCWDAHFPYFVAGPLAKGRKKVRGWAPNYFWFVISKTSYVHPDPYQK